MRPCVLLLLALGTIARADDLARPLPAPVTLAAGDFQVAWTDAGHLVVRHPRAPGRTLWESRPGRPFVAAARGQTRIHGQRGFFKVEERDLRWTGRQAVDAVEQDGPAVVVRGRLLPRSGVVHVLGAPAPTAALPYTLRLEQAAARHLRVVVALDLPDKQAVDRVALIARSDPDERFVGFGEQFTHLDLKGRRLPVIVREQGIGRGVQPVSTLLNAAGGGAAGDWSTTYAPVPQYVTTRLRSLFLEDAAPSFFDLTDPRAARVEVLGDALHARVLLGGSPLELIEAFTEYAGRMRPLPDWAHEGLIVGAVGGPARIRRLADTLARHDVPVAGFFLQDWVGERKTPFGIRLWWTWTPDPATYPDWPGFVAELRGRGHRVLSYVNPWLVDARARGAGPDLFAQARDGGHLVQDARGRPYLIGNGGFDAALVDLTSPDARAWLKELIRRELLGSGVSGWMGDFGEALPFDARLAAGDPRDAHNRWPELWAELQAEVVAEAGLDDEVVFFSRSGFTRSPGATRLFWLGDQLCSWDRHDGIKSALTGLLSSGISGFSLNHGDAGGYTTVALGPLTFFRRPKELLLRWVELSAFTVMLRTHEGLVPGAAGGHQVDSDAETLDHLARMTKVFRALQPYRRALMTDAAAHGWPLVRHPWLHAPEHPDLLREQAAFLLGPDLFVAPVLDPGRAHVDATLPPGRWVDVWTGAVHGDPARPLRVRLPAPIGRPAVLHRAGSAHGEAFVRALEREGLR